MLLGYGSHSLGISDVPSEGWVHILAEGASQRKYGMVSMRAALVDSTQESTGMLLGYVSYSMCS